MNEIHEVDRMIDTLIKELSNRKEETVLVLYGDHLPSLDIQKDDLSNANLYQTQYVIWDNMNLKKPACISVVCRSLRSYTDS